MVVHSATGDFARIARISIDINGDGRYDRVGTGFLLTIPADDKSITNNDIVSCGHLFANLGLAWSGMVQLGAVSNSSGAISFIDSARIVQFDSRFLSISDGDEFNSLSESQWDYSLISIDEDWSRYSSFGWAYGEQNQAVGTTVQAAGYPDYANGNMDTAFGTITGLSGNVIRHSVEVGPGSSGAPIWNATGQVLGIHVASTGRYASDKFAMQFREQVINDLTRWASANDWAMENTPLAPPADIPGNTSSSAVISAGQSTRSDIGFSGDRDWFRVSVVSGSEYRIDLSRSLDSNLNTFLSLFDTFGSPISSNEDFGESINSQLIYTADSTRTLYVSVGGHGSSIGSYTLTVTQTRGPTGARYMTDDVPSYLAALIPSPSLSGTAGTDVLSGTIWADVIAGFGGNDVLSGGDGDDILIGGLSNDTLNGGTGNDLLIPGGGIDSTDGGPGLDTVVYWNERRTYSMIIRQGGTVTIGSDDGFETHVNVERFRFSDGSLAFDTTGSAGQAYRLFQAAFGRVPDTSGLSYWTSRMDGGTNLREVTASFIDSQEFRNRYSTAPGDAAFMQAMYQNVLGRAPDPDGNGYWQERLGQGLSRIDVLMAFSESSETVARVSAAIQDGIWLL